MWTFLPVDAPGALSVAGSQGCTHGQNKQRPERSRTVEKAWIFDTDTQSALYKNDTWQQLWQRAATCVLEWLQRRSYVHGCIKHVSAFSQESLFYFSFFFFHPSPTPPVLCLILDVNSEPVVERKQPTHPCTGWLLIKCQTATSCITSVGLGTWKEQARLDRCCFLATRLRGGEGGGVVLCGRRVQWRPIGGGGLERGRGISKYLGHG